MSKNNKKKKRDITDTPDNIIREEDIEDLDAEQDQADDKSPEASQDQTDDKSPEAEPDHTDDKSPEASQGEAVSVSKDKTEDGENKE